MKSEDVNRASALLSQEATLVTLLKKEGFVKSITNTRDFSYLRGEPLREHTLGVEQKAKVLVDELYRQEAKQALYKIYKELDSLGVEYKKENVDRL